MEQFGDRVINISHTSCKRVKKSILLDKKNDNRMGKKKGQEEVKMMDDLGWRGGKGKQTL